MAYFLPIGLRYLRGATRGTVSSVTATAVVGVALGVAALLVVLSITTGFEKEFRDKVLGVNAHVLVMKYGVDFDEYEDVIARARAMPEVAGAGPFLIHQMMLIHGDHTASVLVKGVDPQGVIDVLSLPRQLVQGSLEGLRLEGAEPPPAVEFENGPHTNDWSWLEDLASEGRSNGGSTSGTDGTNGTNGTNVADGGVPEDGGTSTRNDALRGIDPDRARQFIARGGGHLFGPDGRPVPEVRLGSPRPFADETTPSAPLDVPARNQRLLSPEEMEAIVGEDDFAELPDDASEAALVSGQPTEVASEGPLPGMLVGITLARTLGLSLGDEVRLVSPLTGLGVSSAATNRAAVSRNYKIIGIFEAGFQEYDSQLCYVDLFEAQHFYGQGDSVTGVELRLHDLDRANDVARRLDRELGGPFHTLDWMELNHNLFTALAIQKVALSLVFSAITIVASFMVVVTLIMTVLEKKREIAILKAMGASDLDILLVFMVQGLVVGLVGALVGVAIGAGLVYALDANPIALDPKVYLIDHVPVVIRPQEFVTAVLVALGICGTATLFPSLAAARMIPVDGLRHE